MELNGKASISKTTPNIINAFFIVSLFGFASYEKGLRKTRMKMAMISCNPQPATLQRVCVFQFESRFQLPATIAVVNHLLGHAPVYADVLAGDEASHVGAKEKYHMGNVHGVTHASCGLLNGIGALVVRVGGIYPSG